MTNQELFDRVAKHLLSQGEKSIAGQQCKYRGPNGTKCAIGCLISDEMYQEDLEGVKVSGRVLDAAGLTDSQLLLAMDLQDVHDGSSVEEWPMLLKCVANSYGLVSP